MRDEEYDEFTRKYSSELKTYKVVAAKWNRMAKQIEREREREREQSRRRKREQ